MRTSLSLVLVASLGTPVFAQFTLPLERPVAIAHADGSLTVRIGRHEASAPAPSGELATEVVTLAHGRKVGVVRIGTFAALVTVERGRPSILWSGDAAPRGDPGERRRELLELEDRTGDGVPDVVVGFARESQRICGQDQTLLRARAVDPATGRLRPVVLRTIPESAEEEVVIATRERPEGVGGDGPLLRLIPTGASTRSGLDPELGATPVGLGDADPATAWVEGHGGNGRFEFASARWSAPYPLRAFGIVPRPVGALGERTAAPHTFWLVGDEGSRLRVELPETPAAGERWWIIPETPRRWRCVSLVLDAPHASEPSAAVAVAELEAYTDLDFGGGIDALVARLGAADSEAASAARLLGELGAPAVEALLSGWADRSPPEKRLAVRVFGRQIALERAREGLLQAALDSDEEVRDAALDALEQAGEVADATLAELVAAPGPGDRAASLLARRDPLRAVPAILEAMARTDRPALREPLRTAAQRGGTDALAPLDPWLTEAPVSARAAAALAFARGGLDDPAASAAEAALDATEFVDRWRLVAAAERLPSGDALDRWLAEQARADEWMLRATAIHAIAERTPDARDVARAALEDDYPRVRAAAAAALAGDPEDTERLAVVARRDSWPLVRAAAVEALVGQARALPILRASVRDRSKVVREAAIRGLLRSEDDDVEATWTRVDARLKDDDEWPRVLRAGVAYARARCRPDALPALVAVVERALRPNAWAPDVDVAALAVEAAAAIGGEDADALLARAADELAPAILQRAVREARARRPTCDAR